MWYAFAGRRRSNLVVCALIVSLCALAHVSPADTKDGNPRKEDSPRPLTPPRGHGHRSVPPRQDFGALITVTSATDSTISIEWNRAWNWWQGGVAGYRLFMNGFWVASTGNTAYTFTNLSCATS